MVRLPRLRDRRSQGQSLVEFALVLPIILLLMLTALDFGRVYLGYINLQNMARIAANYAANNPTTDWTNAADAVVVQYRNQILNDAKANNCALPVVAGVTQVPAPVYTDQNVPPNGGTKDLGDAATVQITCSFAIITPVISNIVGTNGKLDVSAMSEFPIKKGLGGTSGAVLSAPGPNFVGTPINGSDPLTVSFTDQSTNGPTAWLWDFHDGVTSTDPNPIHTFTGVGFHTVTLTATNGAGSATITKVNYIAVSNPPIVIDFTASPTAGVKPLSVQFTDTSTTVPTAPTAWAWTFGDGQTSTAQNPIHVYTVAGTYSVRLTATYPSGPAAKTVPNMITVSVGTCPVPDFVGTSTSGAQALWASKGFTTLVNIVGSPPYTIGKQNQTVGQVIPCDSDIKLQK